MSLRTESIWIAVLEITGEFTEQSTPRRLDRAHQWIKDKKRQYHRLLVRKEYQIYLQTSGINQDRHGQTKAAKKAKADGQGATR